MTAAEQTQLTRRLKWAGASADLPKGESGGAAEAAYSNRAGLSKTPARKRPNFPEPAGSVAGDRE